MSRRSESLIHSEGGWHLEVSKMLPPAIDSCLHRCSLMPAKARIHALRPWGALKVKPGTSFAPAMLLRSRCLADRRAARLAPTS